ncbi:MAG: hypothetical protein M1825_003676 [Sarcosagium campestre]|nr:MAG: hypothetical protein M1825_003676 [Sarcosagium campestre]
MALKSTNQGPIINIIGATGTGKSKLAVSIAKRFNGEIINGDAMQMYSGLPLITNKIPTEERKGIPHHLLGCVNLQDEPWHVGRFTSNALRIIREVRTRGHLPILVGGTHYYTQALLFDQEIISNDASASQHHIERFDRESLARKYPILAQPSSEMLEYLRQIDPAMAARWHPNEERKIRRSIEIYLTTGKPASAWYEEQSLQRALDPQARPVDNISDDESRAVNDESHHRSCFGRFDTLTLWVHAQPDALMPRLNARVDSMMQNGLLGEIDALNNFSRHQSSLGHVLDRSRGIWVSIGYKEFEGYISAIHAGTLELDRLQDDAIDRVKSATRRYAKRQVRWIRYKLLRALIDAGYTSQTFLLDGGCLERWEDNVIQPSFDIVDRFLVGALLPDPLSLSELAAEMLVPGRLYRLQDRRELWVRRDCESCGVNVLSEDWEKHVATRRHRKIIKKKQRDATNKLRFHRAFKLGEEIECDNAGKQPIEVDASEASDTEGLGQDDLHNN